MAYVVTETCIMCKYNDCVEVCPVDCFYEGENMLVINPDECIDCGVCEPECPIGAIEPESEDNVQWLEVNREFSQIWPSVTQNKEAMENADDYKDEPNKFDKYFSEAPGKGD
jgi:ferredoxin